MPPWSVIWTEQGRKDLRRLPQEMQRRAITAVDRYALSELGDVRRLQGVTPPLWRLRVGEYRVLLVFDYDEHAIRVQTVAGRGGVYRGF